MYITKRFNFLMAILAISLTSFMLVCFALTHTAQAVQTIPYKMNFQGRLTDSSGQPMANGTYNMKFRIYNASTSGSLKWSETRALSSGSGVELVDGLFSVQLGDVTSLPPAVFTSQNLYFEVEMPTPATATCAGAGCANYSEGPMTPRNKLGSSAYAFNADQLDGLDSSDFGQLNANNTFSGSNLFGGDVTVASGKTLTANGVTKVKADSTAAFQIQNAAGSNTILSIDTTGLGKLSVNGATSLAGDLTVTNAGDSSLEFTNSTSRKSIYVGQDSSNADAFTIGSSTAAANGVAASYVQGKINSQTGGSSASSMSSSFTSNVTVGNTIVVVVNYDNTSGGHTITCSDSQGNSFTNVAYQINNSTGQAITICYAPVTSGGTDTVTASFSPSAAFRQLAISEYSGILTSSPVDVTTSGEGNSTSATSGSVTTTEDGDLIYGAIVNGDDSLAPGAGSGFTSRLSNGPLMTQDQVQGSAGAIASTNTFSSARLYASAVVAFKSQPMAVSDSFNNPLFSLSQTGQSLFRNSSDSTTAFQIQNTAGSNTILSVDTTGSGKLSVNGATSLAGDLTVHGSADIDGDINTSGYYRQNGEIVINTDYVSKNTFLGLAGNTTMTGSWNTATGHHALQDNTTGVNNTAQGVWALQSNTTGSWNTATGYDALQSNTTGGDNTATGNQALELNTTGEENTASGSQALLSNTTGSWNTANGYKALLSNTIGVNNSATGDHALQFNTTGEENTASGSQALQLNTTGTNNTANGYKALLSNTIGANNSATGDHALQFNTSGDENTASGSFALQSNTTGNSNTALGYSAGSNLTSGSNNILIGKGIQAPISNTGDNQLNIGDAIYGNLSTGNINIKGTVTGGQGSPDYAENITASDSSIKAGDVVMMDPAHPDQAIKAVGRYNQSLLGIISTHPGFVTNATAMGADDDSQRPLALSGRVPVKVSTANGPIAQGDYLTSSDIPGVAIKATEVGAVIGRAMTSFDGTGGDAKDCGDSARCGEVTVFIDNSYYNPVVAGHIQGSDISPTGNGNIAGNLTVGGKLNVSGATSLTSLTVTGAVTFTGVLMAQDATFNGTLTVNGHIVTTGDTPLVATGEALGAGQSGQSSTDPTATLSGTDNAGTVKVTAGTQDQTSGVLAHITFAEVFGVSYKAVLSATNNHATDLRVYIVKTSTGFDIVTRDAPKSGVKYQFDYIILGAN